MHRLLVPILALLILILLYILWPEKKKEKFYETAYPIEQKEKYQYETEYDAYIPQ